MYGLKIEEEKVDEWEAVLLVQASDRGIMLK